MHTHTQRTGRSSGVRAAKGTRGERARTERERVRRHIASAERAAHARDVTGLDPLKALVRGLLLELLAQYRAEGEFPQNLDFEGERRPYFIDARGVRCAMAHLLEMGGEGALVERIARERNNAYVRELADEPRLIAWLEAAGLTVEEAAAIQPSYSYTRADCLCGGAFRASDVVVPSVAVFEAVTLTETSPSVATPARVERVHGDGETAGVRAGDTVLLSPRGVVAAGTRVLAFAGAPAPRDAGAPVDAGTTGDGGAFEEAGAVNPSAARYAWTGLTSAGTFTCTSSGQGPAPDPLTPAEVAALVAGSPGECRAQVTAMHPSWAGSSSAGGCRVAPGAHAAAGLPDTLGILVALVGAVSARRVARAYASRAARG